MEKNKEKTILLTANANIGVGLWTSICVGFCAIFGRESLHYRQKVSTAINLVKNRLNKAMKDNPDYDFEDFRIVKEGKLSFVGTVLGTLKEEK